MSDYERRKLASDAIMELCGMEGFGLDSESEGSDGTGEEDS